MWARISTLALLGAAACCAPDEAAGAPPGAAQAASKVAPAVAPAAAKKVRRDNFLELDNILIDPPQEIKVEIVEA